MNNGYSNHITLYYAVMCAVNAEESQSFDKNRQIASDIGRCLECINFPTCNRVTTEYR